MKWLAAQEMMDIPLKTSIARQADDRTGHVVDRSQMKRQVEIGDCLELRIDPHEAPDEVRLIADRMPAIAGDRGEAVD